MTVKTIIASTRDFNEYDLLCETVSSLPWKITTLLSGSNNKADTLNARWAKENNIPITYYKADWYNMDNPEAIIKINLQGKEYDANAGPRRNKRMVDNADALIAFWDEKSIGVRDIIIKARKKGLTYAICYYKEEVKD